MGMVKDIWMPPHDSLPQKWVAVTHHTSLVIHRESHRSQRVGLWRDEILLVPRLVGLVGLSWTLDPLCFFVDNLTRAFFNVCWPFGMVSVSGTSKAFQDVLGNQKLTFTSFHVALVICMWSCCATSIIFVGAMAWEVLVRNIWKGTEKHGPSFSQLVDVICVCPLYEARKTYKYHHSSGSSNLTTSVVTSRTGFSIKYLSSPRFCRAIVFLFLFQSFSAVDPFAMFYAEIGWSIGENWFGCKFVQSQFGV